MSSSTQSISTITTTAGELPVPQVFPAEGLQVLAEPVEGMFAIAPVRGRLRTVRIDKVTPKRVTVTCTTPSAVEQAHELAAPTRAASVEAQRAYDLNLAANYIEQAECIERLNIEPTEDRPVGEKFVEASSLPAEFTRLDRYSRGRIIVNKPETFRRWAEASTGEEGTARYEQKLAEAAAWDVLPAAERIARSITTTEKIVKREQVFALPAGA